MDAGARLNEASVDQRCADNRRTEYSFGDRHGDGLGEDVDADRSDPSVHVLYHQRHAATDVAVV
jgi:hypothetical protein